MPRPNVKTPASYQPETISTKVKGNARKAVSGPQSQKSSTANTSTSKLPTTFKSLRLGWHNVGEFIYSSESVQLVSLLMSCGLTDSACGAEPLTCKCYLMFLLTLHHLLLALSISLTPHYHEVPYDFSKTCVLFEFDDGR